MVAQLLLTHPVYLPLALTPLPIDPHRQLLQQLLDKTNTMQLFETRSMGYSEYPFPPVLLLDPPPVWTPIRQAPTGSRSGRTTPPRRPNTHSSDSSHESPHQSPSSPPVDPAHQYLMNLTRALTEEILRTPSTPNVASAARAISSSS